MGRYAVSLLKSPRGGELPLTDPPKLTRGYWQNNVNTNLSISTKYAKGLD